MGLLDLLAAIGFVVLLPLSRNFARQLRLEPRYHVAA
jgi:hypothetical protein